MSFMSFVFTRQVTNVSLVGVLVPGLVLSPGTNGREVFGGTRGKLVKREENQHR